MRSTSLNQQLSTFSIFLFLLLGAVVACTPTSPTPTPADDVMLRDGYFPKLIATVEISPTAGEVADLATPTATGKSDPANNPEDFSLAPTSTPTNTPTTYVGVFLGEPTSVGPEGEIIIPPTLAPIAGVPVPNGHVGVPQVTILSTSEGIIGAVGNCSVAVASVFAAAYSSNPNMQTLGCPVNAGSDISLVTQRFERGRMFWRDTRQMIVVSDAGTFWRVNDNWQEGMPADDPSLSPPEGMSQPVRGFGMAWRENEAFRNAIGWALGPELPIAGFWQDFEGGTLLLGDGNRIYAIPSSGTGQYFSAG